MKPRETANVSLDIVVWRVKPKKLLFKPEKPHLSLLHISSMCFLSVGILSLVKTML